RYGVMHRNSFMNSPELLEPTYQSRKDSRIFFAGQMTGVEGYVESAASGLIAGINAARLAKAEELVVFPRETAIGLMSNLLTLVEGNNLQTINASSSLLLEITKSISDKK